MRSTIQISVIEIPSKFLNQISMSTHVPIAIFNNQSRINRISLSLPLIGGRTAIVSSGKLLLLPSKRSLIGHAIEITTLATYCTSCQSSSQFLISADSDGQVMDSLICFVDALSCGTARTDLQSPHSYFLHSLLLAWLSLLLDLVWLSDLEFPNRYTLFLFLRFNRYLTVTNGILFVY